MRMIALLAVLSVSVSPLTAACGGTTVAPATDPKTDATNAATEWLVLIDQGNYEESWSRASSQFQGATTATEWASVGSAARSGFGNLTARTLQKATPMKDLAGAQPGDYYILDFNSVFDVRGAVTEQVAVFLEGGVWRAAGYYIM
jgi:hypothetical protein